MFFYENDEGRKGYAEQAVEAEHSIQATLLSVGLPRENDWGLRRLKYDSAPQSLRFSAYLFERSSAARCLGQSFLEYLSRKPGRSCDGTGTETVMPPILYRISGQP